MSLLGPVVEPGPRRRPAEPQIVGSNPTRPASRPLGSKLGIWDCPRTVLTPCGCSDASVDSRYCEMDCPRDFACDNREA